MFDNVALPLREQHALDEETIRELVMLKLHQVELAPGDAWKMPAELSGGMVKRAALARALVLDPDVLFLDEPTSGLDPIAADAIVALIASLHEQLCLTVVAVTHDLDTLLGLGGRVAVLADHRIVADGPLEEVVRVDHPFIRDYFFNPRSRRLVSQLMARGQEAALDEHQRRRPSMGSEATES